MNSQQEVVWSLENGYGGNGSSCKEIIWNGKTAQTVTSSILRKKSDPVLVSNVRFKMLRQFLENLQEVILGTKLAVLFPAIPLAVAADFYNFGRVSARVRTFYMYIYIHI